MTKFFFAGSTNTISAHVVCRGPKAVVLGLHYKQIYLLDENGCVTKLHSHGYTGHGWMPYFRSVCG